MEFPKEIKGNEKVYILDFSFKNMDELYKKFEDNLVWIDHHQIIKEFEHVPIKGYRKTTVSACYLSWKWCKCWSEKDKIPEWVQLLSDYDTWNQSDLKKWNDVILPFQFGIQLEKTDPKENWDFWDGIFSLNSFETNDKVTKYINRGQSVIDYLDIKTKKLLNKESFEVTFEGYNAIITNMYTVPPNVLKMIDNHIDLLINFQNFQGKAWIINLRSSTIDVSKIAKKYSGGGHQCSAGFIWNKHIEDLFRV